MRRIRLIGVWFNEAVCDVPKVLQLIKVIKAVEMVKEILTKIEVLLRQVENEFEVVSKASVTSETVNNETAFVVADAVDFLMPLLTSQQFSIYCYLFRHSYLSEGKPYIRVGIRFLQKNTFLPSARGGTKEDSFPSYKQVKNALNALTNFGAIRQEGEADRNGTLYRILLPEEIASCRELKAQKNTSSPVETIDADVDFYNVRENRLKIFERDEFKCTYCGKQLTRFTATLDHVTPVKEGGDNSQENLTTACLKCNSQKNSQPVGDFLVDRNS